MVLPITQLVYFYGYGTPVTPAACLALLQTNTSEAAEYLCVNLGYFGIAAVAFIFIACLFFFIKANIRKIYSFNLSGKSFFAVVLLCLLTGSYCASIFMRTGALHALHNARDYLRNAALFDQLHEKSLKDLEVTLPAVHPKRPSTIILVIGESASRYFMSAYKEMERDNTPWMRANSANQDFILFRHAYSSWPQTVPCLERALTEKNQYNAKEFHSSLSIIDLGKMAGYETWWFSAQDSNHMIDTPITLVAKTADHSAWLEDTLAGTKQKKYDTDLLPYLKQIDPSKNNFIVLHLMGSHVDFSSRYPPEFARWEGPSAIAREGYDNSLAYTDKFLEDVHAYGTKYLNLQAMLYFSDHGLNPTRKRNPDLLEFISLRVPMFLYLSPEYQHLYPGTAAALRSHANSYFTNDLIYEMVAGILNITSNHYDETNSIASHKYKYTRETLKTRLGQVSLADDKDEDE